MPMPRVITKPLQLPLTQHEAYALLRLIAQGNDHRDTASLDRQTGTWLADRIVRLIEDEFGAP